MAKTKIEWCDYTINPVKGLCPMACSYCYARAMYKRFKWNPKIRLDGNAMTDFPSKPSRIFVGSTMELFGDWVDPEWMEQIMALPHNFPQHTFLFLTKQPQNLIKWSPFPSNCWVGVSTTTDMAYTYATYELKKIEAKVKYISFEPLLQVIDCNKPWDKRLTLSGIKWIIIGAQTKPYRSPKIEWVKEIVDACDKAGIPVFLKENLRRMWGYSDSIKLRQEIPQEMSK